MVAGTGVYFPWRVWGAKLYTEWLDLNDLLRMRDLDWSEIVRRGIDAPLPVAE